MEMTMLSKRSEVKKMPNVFRRKMEELFPLMKPILNPMLASKSTLFLALVRSAHPELGAVVVYVPNHAFAGVALDPVGGDRSFARNGVRYVGVEPVGPARIPVGKVSGKSGWHLFWHSAETRALPAPK